MGIAVCNGAVCQCSFGASPCSLVVTSVTNVTGENFFLASVMDYTSSNLATFGMCSSMANPAVSSATAAALGVLTPQPCSPVILSPWTPASSTVLFANQPALNHMAKANCTYGGVIQIINPGQKSIQIP